MAIFQYLVHGNNINVFLSDDCIVAKGMQSLTKFPKQYEQKCTKKIFKHILAYFWHFYRRRFGYFMHITLQFIDQPSSTLNKFFTGSELAVSCILIFFQVSIFDINVHRIKTIQSSSCKINLSSNKFHGEKIQRTKPQ